MASTKEITRFLDEELRTHEIKDSANNGLQVEADREVTKIGFAVDASVETFEKAVEAGCEMLMVHHGVIWGGLKHVAGTDYRRLKRLLDNNLALYVAHLPLDMHPKYGNNIQLAKLLGLNKLEAFGEYEGIKIGFKGELDSTIEEIIALLKKNGIQTLQLPFGQKKIRTVGIVSGGAAINVFDAIKENLDLYITGEPVHHAHHLAKENNIHVIFGGHYETEVWGVKALMPLLAEKYSVATEFLDVPTLV